MNRFDLQDKSDEYVKELADSGNYTAIFDYAYRMYNQDRYEEAFAYFYKIKDYKNTFVWQMIIEIALSYLPGVISDEEIYQFLLRRHEAGVSIYTYYLADFYEKGRGCRKSLKKYIECLASCAYDGSSYATIELAECYERGYAVRKSYRKAFKLYDNYLDDHCRLDYECAYRSALYMLHGLGGAKNSVYKLEYNLRYAARINHEAKDLYIQLYNKEPD